MKQDINMTNKNSASEKIDAHVLTQSQMGQDLKNAVLIVSIVANLFVLTGWVALQVTGQYDAQVEQLLFNQ